MNSILEKPTLEKEAIKPADAAFVASMSPRKMHSLIKEGRGPKTFRIGGSVLILRTDLTAWLHAQAEAGSPASA